MYNVRVHMHIIVDPVPCGEILSMAFFGMSWPKYGDISRAAGFRSVARNTVIIS